MDAIVSDFRIREAHLLKMMVTIVIWNGDVGKTRAFDFTHLRIKTVNTESLLFFGKISLLKIQMGLLISSTTYVVIK